MDNLMTAKKSAALEVCRKLLEIGELDPENLLPKSRESWQEDVVKFMGGHQRETVASGPLPGSTGRVQSYKKKVRKRRSKHPKVVTSILSEF